MREVKIGLAGCGLFGESHLQAFRAVPGVKIQAAFDPERAVAEERARAFGIERVCDSLEQMCAMPDLDAIDVVSPEHLHLDPVLRAIAAGKHVFCEKPLATDLADCDRMIEAARSAGRILMPGHILRFETKYAMLKDEVASGRLGRVVAMYARRNRPARLLERYGRNHPAIENCIHDIDLMLWYTQDRVRRVRGFGRRATNRKHHDTFFGVLEFEGGALGVVETIWLLPDAAGVSLDDFFQLTGDRGTANVGLMPPPISYWRDTGHEAPDFGYDPRVAGEARGALRDELACFVESVRAGRDLSPLVPVDGKNAVRVSLALIESGYSEKDVEITDWN
jgi:UDP-N-acetylglucosamine 3-dehydrogenase